MISFFAWVGNKFVLPFTKRRPQAKIRIDWEYKGYIYGEIPVTGCIEDASDPDDALYALQKHIDEKWNKEDAEGFRVKMLRPLHTGWSHLKDA